MIRGPGRTSGPLSVAKTALSRAARLKAGAHLDLEMYVEFGATATVSVFGGRAESVATAEPQGIGVRCIDSGRVGYSYTADLSDSGLDRVILESIGNARAAEPDPFQALPDRATGYAPLNGLWRPGVSGTSLADKLEIAMRAESAALARPDVHAVEISRYSDLESRIAIVSSRGVEVEGEQSFCFAYVLALAGGERDTQSGLGFTTGREPEELDPNEAGAEAAAKARALLGATPCATGLYTVVFERESAAALLSAVAAALSAEAVQKGRSVFRGRLRETVASEAVNLRDNGLAVGGLSTSPFDAEGQPQKDTVLIQRGVLQAVLHNVYTARKESAGVLSTGNATRGSYRFLPTVGVSNLILEDGRGTTADLVARVGEGLCVDGVTGLHSGINPATGEISVGVTGHLIEGGEKGSPVREVTIACDFVGLLSSICDIASDSRWIPLYGSVRTPSIAVGGVAVSGR